MAIITVVRLRKETDCPPCLLTLFLAISFVILSAGLHYTLRRINSLLREPNNELIRSDKNAKVWKLRSLGLYSRFAITLLGSTYFNLKELTIDEHNKKDRCGNRSVVSGFIVINFVFWQIVRR